MLGPGTSRLSEQLWAAGGGALSVTSVDISPTVVARMAARAAAAGCRGNPSGGVGPGGAGGPGGGSPNAGAGVMRWDVGDMLALPYADGAFDFVVEKGTLDVLMTDVASPWAVPPAAAARMGCAVDEAFRVLAPAGRLLSITFASPLFRRPQLQLRPPPPAVALEEEGEPRPAGAAGATPPAPEAAAQGSPPPHPPAPGRGRQEARRWAVRSATFDGGGLFDYYYYSCDKALPPDPAALLGALSRDAVKAGAGEGGGVAAFSALQEHMEEEDGGLSHCTL